MTNNVQQIQITHPSPQEHEHESVDKYENVSDEFVEDYKPEINYYKNTSYSIKTEPSAIELAAPFQKRESRIPSLSDTSSFDSSQSLQANKDSNRSITIPSPSTSPCPSPPSSPHLHLINLMNTYMMY